MSLPREELEKGQVQLQSLVSNHFFRNTRARDLPTFDSSEIGVGPRLGVGGFGVVCEVQHIKLDSACDGGDVQDDDDATTPETAGDQPMVEESGIDYENQEEAADDIEETPVISDEMRAEAREQFGVSQRVASMLPAEYELWLFPAMGSPGYHEGKVTLARVINNLTSAGYNKDTLGYDAVIYPKLVQIAAATWSQTNYCGVDVVETRTQLTLAPASQVVDLLPNVDDVTPDLMAPAFPQVDTIEIDLPVVPEKSYLAPALIGVASLSALVLPIMLVRRSMQ